MRSEIYQLSLIFFMALTAVLFGFFLWDEVYPEYKIYQETYQSLEEFRSGITGEPPAPFKYGVKQIVLTQDRNGPEIIDRCTSCHVALELTHFSPTKVAKDINGKVLVDAEGNPVKVANEEYIWGVLDAKISMLTDETELARLKDEGRQSEVYERISEADALRALKTTEMEGREIDMTKVLAMHPLLGKETRPFEFHSANDYGCTVCHNGNGRSLTLARAHGPVFDGQYEESFQGPHPDFLESDAHNDPKFSKVFNHKPGHALLFQTTPLYPGNLIEANCVQCHLTSTSQLQGALTTVAQLKSQTAAQTKSVEGAFTNERKALLSLYNLEATLESSGYQATIAHLKQGTTDYSLPGEEREAIAAQLALLTHVGASKAQQTIHEQILISLGTDILAKQLAGRLATNEGTPDSIIQSFAYQHMDAKGALFAKAEAAEKQKVFLEHMGKAEASFQNTIAKDQVKQAIATDVDRMTKCYQRGEELYITQACYACHRIAGFARGGVGPELTWEGNSYPWFVKESIVWPQADLRTSTMPNYRLDHDELEALMCFLLAQKGRPRAMSQVEYDVSIKQWEEGKKRAWEEPVSPAKIHDVRFGMTVFATEGCSSCHRLKGFDSNVGFAIEKGRQPTFDEMYQERQWFSSLFSEEMLGSQIAETIATHAEEIDKHLVDDVRQGSILEEIEQSHPKLMVSLYPNFRFALRANNDLYEQKAAKESALEGKKAVLAELDGYQQRVERVLKMYVQEYGLGRQVGPRTNWSGIYRSDEWLMEHFYNPGAHVARSIMPVFPFDETKFYSLVNMLDHLAKHNAAEVRQIWDNRGFNPSVAYQLHCAQCHGDFRQGDGPVAEWLYPIPKNLRNGLFLRNLTQQRAVESITHGVRGGPMPPWGEVARDKTTAGTVPVLKGQEIDRLVQWLYQSLPDDGQNPVVPLKWKYQPQDVLRELREEGDILEGGPLSCLPKGTQYLASLNPQPTPKSNEMSVDQLFDIKAYPVAGVERKAYYIKQEYYTPHNIEEGQRAFIQDCAICHGKEGAGNGLRAGIMEDAKPRMLTNLDWIETRDDLRLLQSIKYGVPGTAMTPWGDYTSTLQRLQLVIYIRSLSREHLIREHLTELLYHTFDRSVETIRHVQIEQYEKLQELQHHYEVAETAKEELDSKLATDKESVAAAVDAYQKQLSIGEELKKQQAVDQLLQRLISEVKHQRDLYFALSSSLLARLGEGDIVQEAIDLIAINAVHYDLVNGRLELDPHTRNVEEIAASGQHLAAKLETSIAALEKEKTAIQGQLPSSERYERLSELNLRLHTYTQLRVQVLSSLQDAARSRRLQAELVKQINQQIEALQPKKSETVPMRQSVSHWPQTRFHSLYCRL